MQIIFFTVKNSSSKIKAILQTIDAHIQKKEKITLLAPDVKALHFLDDLLWSHPKESFRPHSIGMEVFSSSFISLTTPQPLAQYGPIVFNLCATSYPSLATVKLLYELEDISHPEKTALFQKKFHTYQKSSYPLTAGTILEKKC